MEEVSPKESIGQNKRNIGAASAAAAAALNTNDAAQAQEGNISDKADKTNGLIGPAMSFLSHLIFAIFTIYIIYICFEDYNLFSWHPTCMTIGSLLLMGEAVMIMSQDNIIAAKLSRQGRVRMHWILQAGAAACIFIGFVIIVISKNMIGKNHFISWHSILGLVFIIFVGVTSSGGVVTLYAFGLKKAIRPAKLKLLHNLAGILTFSLGVVTEIFGLYTRWFPSHSSLSAQVVCTVFVALGGIFTLECAVKSAYMRFKNLNQSR